MAVSKRTWLLIDALLEIVRMLTFFLGPLSMFVGILTEPHLQRLAMGVALITLWVASVFYRKTLVSRGFLGPRKIKRKGFWSGYWPGGGKNDGDS